MVQRLRSVMWIGIKAGTRRWDSDVKGRCMPKTASPGVAGEGAGRMNAFD
jgi:hypothetical protein